MLQLGALRLDGFGIVKLVLAVWLHASHVYALKCYASSQDGRTVSLEEHADWQYCVYQEALYTYATDSHPPVHVTSSRPSYFGATHDNMDLQSTDGVFGDSEPPYKVISNCVLEKYSGGAVGSPAASAPEFAFRCLCAEDGCNKGSNFKHFRNHNVRQNALK